MGKPKFQTKWFYSSIGHYEEIRNQGIPFINRKAVKVKVPTPETANYDEFAEQIQLIYNQFDADGYDVVNIIPLAIGASDQRHATLSNGAKNYLGDVGFSVTRGAIVVGKLRDL